MLTKGYLSWTLCCGKTQTNLFYAGLLRINILFGHFLFIEFDIWIQFDIKREGKAEDFPDERRIWIKSFCSKGKQWLLTLTRAEFKVDADRPNFPVHWSLFESRSFYNLLLFFERWFPNYKWLFEEIFSSCPFVLWVLKSIPDWKRLSEFVEMLFRLLMSA